MRKIIATAALVTLSCCYASLTGTQASARSLLALSPAIDSGQSQPSTKISVNDLHRAKNLARQAAENANGGLNRYHAEDAMHGPASQTHYVDNCDGTVTFTFTGGPPGYTTPTVQSVVTVDTTSWRVNVDYNGPIRQ